MLYDDDVTKRAMRKIPPMKTMSILLLLLLLFNHTLLSAWRKVEGKEKLGLGDTKSWLSMGR